MTRSADSLSRELTRALQEKVEAQEGLRKKLVGVVLREQWATAIALHRWNAENRNGERYIEDSGWVQRIEALPCPVEAVARYLGEKP